MASAGFLSIHGIDSITDVIEYRDGPEEALPRRLPGLHKYANITLRRDLTNNRELWEWRLSALEGRTDRHNGVIVVHDQAYHQKLRNNIIVLPILQNSCGFA